VVALVNPYGGREERDYDLLDRVTAIREPDGNERRLSYDAEGNLLESSDKLGTTRFTYACWNRLASREEGAAPASAGDIVRFIWGQEGELREIRNERNHDYRFFYDPCLRVEREIGFDLQETRYERNAAGLVTKVEKPAAGGLHRAHAGPPRPRDRRAALRRHRRQVHLPQGRRAARGLQRRRHHQLKRDLLGRVLTESQSGVEVKSHYAAATAPASSPPWAPPSTSPAIADGNLRRCPIGLPSQGWVRTLTFDYDPAGLETRRHLPGGVTAEWQYDRSGRPAAAACLGGPSPSWSRSYQWCLRRSHHRHRRHPLRPRAATTTTPRPPHRRAPG
jgi:YD repeat-containing protein